MAAAEDHKDQAAEDQAAEEQADDEEPPILQTGIWRLVADAALTAAQLRAYLEAHPHASAAVDAHGRTPLHVLAMNRDALSLDALSVLLRDRVDAARTFDARNRSPLCLLFLNPRATAAMLGCVLDECPEAAKDPDRARRTVAILERRESGLSTLDGRQASLDDDDAGGAGGVVPAFAQIVQRS
eukprot:CAMPEP_0185693586 /NCGR_PEP_ID=MMETSP1164-20130828/3327_1 /TAXON_ID=1104430 /ORGANISM="Chrysoreinhardia sp, Strain CCMP2950" /LENGTH=183 /DNA_ID=CAMNT_0028360383 /DNA_START=68 /DNA_END=619 /DNA_ORIENTATION=+